MPTSLRGVYNTPSKKQNHSYSATSKAVFMAGEVINGSKMSSNLSEAMKTSTEIAWRTHWIVFSILFFLMACFSTVLLLKAIRTAPELTKSYRLSVFSLVIILSISRTVYLLLNPYEVDQGLLPNTPVIILRLLYALGQPSLTAAFGLIHASFLNVAKTKHYHHESLLKTQTILVIIGLYFAFGIITEVVTVLLPGMRHMLLVSAALAVIGCTIVTVTVSYSGLRILKVASQNKRALGKTLSLTSLSETKDQVVKAKSIAKVARVTLAASTLCVGLTIANSIVFVKMFDDMTSVEHWNSVVQFVTFVTCVRILELAMAATLIYALCHTNMKLRKILGFHRSTAKKRSTVVATSMNENSAHKTSWKSTSSVSSEKQFIE